MRTRFQRGTWLSPFLFLIFISCAQNSSESATRLKDYGLDPAEAEQPVELPEPLGPNCLPHRTFWAKQVTHYYVPLLTKFNQFVCNKMEGSCIYKKSAAEWLHNYGKKDELLSKADCKNGYGNKNDCLHPCRVLAASMMHHRYGEVLFFPELVGMTCGNKERDGFEIQHDGYMVVLDTGSPQKFNTRGRFDFFWGRCRDRSSGVCLEGAERISKALSKSLYCVAWTPSAPGQNVEFKTGFVQTVRNEALARRDNERAAGFDLD